MKWVTIDEVEKAAKKGKLAAAKCSLKHWRQIYRATPEELKGGIKKGLVSGSGGFCALCGYRNFHNYVGCVLNSRCGVNCCKEYNRAYDAWADFLLENHITHAEFKIEIKPLIDRLKKAVKKLENK